MNVALHRPWTQGQFFAWAEVQEARYEFDGSQPVGMTNGTVNHSRVTRNLLAALYGRLRGGPCEPLGPDAGVETVNRAVRYPDALVTFARSDGGGRLVPDVVVVFEVLSPTSGRVDRIVKVREYAAVSSIRRYVILESSSVGLMVLERADAGEIWRTTVLAEGDVLHIPEIAIEVPVSAVYEGISFPADDA